MVSLIIFCYRGFTNCRWYYYQSTLGRVKTTRPFSGEFFGRVVFWSGGLGSAAGRRIFGRGIQGQPQADLRCFRPKGETPRPQKISLNDTVLMHFLCVKQLFFNQSWWDFLVEGFRFWSGFFFGRVVFRTIFWSSGFLVWGPENPSITLIIIYE